MLNISSSSRGGEFQTFSPQVKNHLWNIEDSSKQPEPTAIHKSEICSTMEPDSPTTPTVSPSPTSSEPSITPTSPTIPQYKSIWGSKSLSIHSPFPKLNTSGLSSPIHRRSTLQLILASPDYQTFTHTGCYRGRKSTHETRSDSPIYGCSGISPSKSKPSTNEEDEDMPMLTPPPHPSPVDDSTTSPILRTLVGIPPTETHATPSQPEVPPAAQTTLDLPTPQSHLASSIHHLGIPLIPLVSVTTGLTHPSFPRSILQYHLLTHSQLDSLAAWYHQTSDNTRERFMYPACIERPWLGVQVTVEVELAAKRRRFGRFIGLRGCDSPVLVERDELAERMEREWVRALKKAEEEERVLEKVWRGRW